MSITLSEDVCEELDRYAGSAKSHSAYIDRVLRRHFRRRAQARDIELINANAERLNAEAEEVLEFQAWPEED